MNIWIVGGGSIGLLYAGLISMNEKARVRLLCRTNEQAQQITVTGIRVLELDQEGQQRAKVTYPEASTLDCTDDAPAGSEPDWILVMVKQQHITEKLAKQLADILPKQGRILCFQNGVGHIELLGRFISKDKVHAVVTTEGANRIDNRTVAHTGKGITWVEEVPGHSEFIELLQKAGFYVNTSKSMDTIVWNKLLINAAINPLSALLRVQNGRLLEQKSIVSVMRDLFEEGRMIARTLGIQVSDDVWDQILTVCKNTASNESSMLQDLNAGRLTEIDRINGALIRYAEQLKLEVPVNRTMYALIKYAEG
jgi:2-dehydropantoate 2-reductase